MTKKELAHFERRLLDERKRLLKRSAWFDESAAEYASASTYTSHMAEQGGDSMQREQAFLFASKEGRFLYHIDEALRRLYENPEQYGQCVECGSEIGFERLDALPHARLCIRCKEAEEYAATPMAAWG